MSLKKINVKIYVKIEKIALSRILTWSERQINLRGPKYN